MHLTPGTKKSWGTLQAWLGSRAQMSPKTQFQFCSPRLAPFWGRHSLCSGNVAAAAQSQHLPRFRADGESDRPILDGLWLSYVKCSPWIRPEVSLVSSWPGMSQMSFLLERRCGSMSLPAWLLRATRWESGNWVTVAKGVRAWCQAALSWEPWEGSLELIGELSRYPHTFLLPSSTQSGRKDAA